MPRSSLAFFFVALPPALLLLFAVQVVLCAPSMSSGSGWLVQPEHLNDARAVAALNLKSLFSGGCPSAIAAWVVMRVVRTVAPRSLSRRSLARIVALLWVFTWVACWLAIYALLASGDPTTWSLSLLTQSDSLYGLAFVALGLYAGARLAPPRSGVPAAKNDAVCNESPTFLELSIPRKALAIILSVAGGGGLAVFWVAPFWPGGLVGAFTVVAVVIFLQVLLKPRRGDLRDG